MIRANKSEDLWWMVESEKLGVFVNEWWGKGGKGKGGDLRADQEKCQHSKREEKRMRKEHEKKRA